MFLPRPVPWFARLGRRLWWRLGRHLPSIDRHLPTGVRPLDAGQVRRRRLDLLGVDSDRTPCGCAQCRHQRRQRAAMYSPLVGSPPAPSQERRETATDLQ